MTALLSTITTVVSHTPIWVWPLYALLLFLGLQRTRDSTVSLPRMLILPLVVVLLAIFGFIVAGPTALPAILLGLLVGGTVGWLLERDGATRRLPDGKLWLRGEWWTFSQILVVFTSRYVTNVVAAMDPALAADVSWRSATLFLSFALSAAFLGRTAARLWVYFATASTQGA
jgi:hypothetical protein